MGQAEGLYLTHMTGDLSIQNVTSSAEMGTQYTYKSLKQIAKEVNDY